MNHIEEIIAYQPKNHQETQDKNLILECIRQFPDTILTRENEIAHITSSGFILNQDLTKALMIHHNIRNTWAWTGGHADGNPNLLEVAIQEAKEETGLSVSPITRQIASLDVLSATGHTKNGRYISSHLHLSIAYLFTANEGDVVAIKPDENSAIEWIPPEEITQGRFSERDVYLYTKLWEQARAWRGTASGGPLS